jgi:tetratricopeptide (TPR) repeat protein/3',5'-cyclic AMP phosphodiesterase CpdA
MKRNAITVLHLSDIQFGKNHRFGLSADIFDGKWDTLLQRIKVDLDEMKDDYGQQPDMVVMTGDLAEWGKKSEFDQVFNFCVDLANHLNLSRDRFVIIPGNHDINRDLCSSYFSECKGNDQTPLEPYKRKYEPFWDNLLLKFYNDVPGVEFRDNLWSFHTLTELKVVVAGLNSTMKDSHRDDDHYGYCGEEQYRWFLSRLEEYKAKEWLRIGAIHHNFRRGSKNDDENLRDADDLTNILSNSLNLLLHGHVHTGRVDWLSQKAPVLATGSAALKKEQRPDEVPNQYQIVRVTRDGVERWCRSYAPGQKKWVGDTQAIIGGKGWNKFDSVSFEYVSGTFHSDLEVKVEDIDVLTPAYVKGVTPHENCTNQYSPSRRVFNVPYRPKGSQVVGRDEALGLVRTQLTEGKPTAIGHTASFEGLGGLGKTQLAVEYAYRFSEDYQNGVIWLNADQDIDAQLTDIAVTAGWIAPESEHKFKLDVALHRLKSYSGTLVIFDNVDDLAAIKSYLPVPGAAPHLLVTSRSLQAGFTAIPLLPLDVGQSMQLLLQEAGRRPSGHIEQDAVRDIVQQLDGLPLALELAGAYLCHRSTMPFASYRDKLLSDPLKALCNSYLSSYTKHDADIFRTLKIDEDIVGEEPLLAAILDILTWSGPSSMGVPLLGTLLHENDAELAGALALGVQLKLLRKEEHEERYALHRLVREVRLREDVMSSRNEWIVETCRRLGDWYQELREDFLQLPLFESEINHLVAWCENARDLAPYHECRLTWLRAYPAHHRGLYADAHALIVKAQEIYEKASITDDALLGHLLNDMGTTYAYLGQYSIALQYAEKALNLRFRLFGEMNIDTAMTHSNIGTIYGDLGHGEKALAHLTKSFEIYTAILPESHLDAARVLNSIGTAYEAIGNHKKALANHRRALDISLKFLGENHPLTAYSYNYAGLVLAEMEHYSEAFEFIKKALDIRISLFAEQHPITATSYDNLGYIYGKKGDYIQKLKNEEKALQIHRQLLGEHNPSTASTLNNIGMSYHYVGQTDKALEYLANSREIALMTLGKQHPDTHTAFMNTASVHELTGDYKKAMYFLQKGYEFAKPALPNKHPLLNDFQIAMRRLSEKMAKPGFRRQPIRIKKKRK